MPAEKISIKGYARAVDTLLGELGVERATLVGNSMGGFVSAEIALSYSTWVERLVLVSAAGLSVEHQRNDHALAVLRRTERLLAMYTGWLASKSEMLTRRPRSRSALLRIVAAQPEKLPAPLTAEMLRGSGKPGFVDALDALTSYPIRDRLDDVQVPTLVVWGEDDVLVPVRDAWEFGELIRDSRVVVYEDTGHMAMLERPEAFNTLVDEFLAE
jgi:pimeloyl-ACP methyl ester carboxylesterase